PSSAAAPAPAAKPVAAPVSAPAAAPSNDKPGLPPATKPVGPSLTPGVNIQGANKAELPTPAAAGSVSRREFLNYVWGASMALFMAQLGGVSFFFAFPRFRKGEQGGKFDKAPTDFPAVGERPNADGVGKFWMIRTPDGAYVHYRVCTHLGCIFAYDDTAQRFACPCHGSQFQRNGDWVAGPAPRGLDRFPAKVYDAAGKVLVDAPDGGPFQIPDTAARIEVDTAKKLLGKSHLV
ncbi:MAG: Rieske 2Fe-2S domain-containing protein, partial [Anaerolineae bacterium]